MHVNGVDLKVTRLNAKCGYVHYETAFGVDAKPIHNSVAQALKAKHWAVTMIREIKPSELHPQKTIYWVLDYAPDSDTLQKQIDELT
jgi:hypothetical protein